MLAVAGLSPKMLIWPIVQELIGFVRPASLKISRFPWLMVKVVVRVLLKRTAAKAADARTAVRPRIMQTVAFRLTLNLCIFFLLPFYSFSSLRGEKRSRFV